MKTKAKQTNEPASNWLCKSDTQKPYEPTKTE